MKPQDILFFIVLVFLIWKRKPRLLVGVGLGFILLAMPLFAKWIFFTAERFTYYAALCFAIAIFLFLLQGKNKK